jgi:hypothetical protein
VCVCVCVCVRERERERERIHAYTKSDSGRAMPYLHANAEQVEAFVNHPYALININLEDL